MERLRESDLLHRHRVAGEGADIADALLTMAIRAIDYLPPVHMVFGDFLSAHLTADMEVRPDDARYRFRETLLRSFRAYGIDPATTRRGREPGTWSSPSGAMVHDRNHHEPLTREPDEVFRFVWENRSRLPLHPGAFTRVQSVRPCVRSAPDGFSVRETVAEVVQHLELRASELPSLRIQVPPGMPPDTRVRLEGGLSLIFDDFGRLKYAISNAIRNARRQTKRLESLWESGYFDGPRTRTRGFAEMHRLRSLGAPVRPEERW